MSTPTVPVLALAALLAPLCFATSALAQESEGFDKELDDSLAAEKQAKDEEATGDKMPGEKEKEAPPEPPSDNSPYEKPGEAYRFVGLRFRDIIVPKFMINLFADGARTVNVFSIGPEFSTRKDGLEIDFALTWADYSMDPFLFKGKSDADDAWEIVESKLGIFYFTTDLLYEIPLDKKEGKFSLLVGGGVGLGIVYGDLNRAQAYPDDASNIDPDDPSKWTACTSDDLATGYGGVAPGTTEPFCDGRDNDHAQGYSESSWVNGGSKPNVFPWISLPQFSFRYKPIKQFQARADLGFSISGFFFGGSLSYGL